MTKRFTKLPNGGVSLESDEDDVDLVVNTSKILHTMIMDTMLKLLVVFFLATSGSCEKRKTAETVEGKAKNGITSILELPGLSINSLTFHSMESHLGLNRLRDSVYKERIESIFTDSDGFYESEIMPLLIVVQNNLISAVCLGGVYEDIKDASDNGIRLDSDALVYFGQFLKESGIYIPYEIFMSKDPDSAIRVFVEPYMDMPSVKHDGNATVVDFTRAFDVYHKIKIYYIGEKFCGFVVYRKSLSREQGAEK